jgi:hypothetical protein
MPVLEVGLDVRHARRRRAAGHASRAGTPWCCGERLQLRRHPRSLCHRGVDGVRIEHLAASYRGVASVEHPVVDPDLVAFVQPGEDLDVDDVDQRDAGADQDLGAEVGVAPRDRGRDVGDRRYLAGDQCLG